MAAAKLRALSALAFAFPAQGAHRSAGPQGQLRLSMRLSRAQTAVGTVDPEARNIPIQLLLEEPLIEVAGREEPRIKLIDRSPLAHEDEVTMEDDAIPFEPASLQAYAGAPDDGTTLLEPPSLRSTRSGVLLQVTDQGYRDDPLLIQQLEGPVFSAFRSNVSRMIDREMSVEHELNRFDDENLEEPLVQVSPGVPAAASASPPATEEPLIPSVAAGTPTATSSSTSAAQNSPNPSVAAGAPAITSPSTPVAQSSLAPPVAAGAPAARSASTPAAAQKLPLHSVDGAGVWKHHGRTWDAPKKHAPKTPPPETTESAVVPEVLAPQKGSLWDKFTWITITCYVLGVGVPLALIVLGVMEQGDLKDPEVLDQQRRDRKAERDRREENRYARVLAREGEAAQRA